MVFRKPYAFFIKYFRLINLLLVVLLCFLIYKLNLIRIVINDIYLGRLTNFSNLNNTYVGFKMVLLIFIIIVILSIILILLKRKKKPLNDYLYGILYIVILVAYLLFVSNIFFNLNDSIIEQTSLKLYTDISLLIIVPMLYFIFKFSLIVIGFNLSKFNFSQDMLDLKQEEKDNEEVEVDFSKNTYKYKRKLRKNIREFKYYYLENRLLISLILGIIFIVFFITFFSMSIFDNNKVNKNENFIAGDFNYKVTHVYETVYDYTNSIIKEDSKFVIVNVIVRNINRNAKSIDLNRIRIVYDNKYSYANNYYNKYFYDLGNIYNKEPLKINENYNYLLIFEVPKDYNSKNYTLKFYDRVTVKDNEISGSYKEMRVKSKNLDKKTKTNYYNLKDKIELDSKKYKNSSINVDSYSIDTKYVYKDNNLTKVIRDNDINKVLLILDYRLNFDEILNMDVLKNDKDFFNKFVNISYNYNGNKKALKSNVIGIVEQKVMLSVPYEIKNANNIDLIFNFRNEKFIYKLK